MKILYANPLFLYYRIPYYKRLNELFGGEFYVLYSVNRYKQRKEWVGVLDKIPEALGDNAIPYDREKVYDTYTKSFSKCSYEQGGKKIPFPVGLFSLNGHHLFSFMVSCSKSLYLLVMNVLVILNVMYLGF